MVTPPGLQQFPQGTLGEKKANVKQHFSLLPGNPRYFHNTT
jgi:hypothetical protein